MNGGFVMSTTNREIRILLLVVMVIASVFWFPVKGVAAITPANPYRFKTAQATVHLSVDAHYNNIWRKALAAWNSKGVFEFKITQSSTAQINILSMPAALKKPNLTGLTYVYHDENGVITKADTYLNNTALTAYRYTDTQRVNVAEHELGHTMGLAHNPSQKSVMYYENRYYPIQPVDVAAVRAHYQQTATVPPMPAAQQTDTFTRDGIRRPELLNHLCPVLYPIRGLDMQIMTYD